MKFTAIKVKPRPEGSMSSVKHTGIGFPGLLTILFIGLKLGHVIDWSWWWITCPLWIVPAIIFVIWACLILAATVLRMIEKLD